MATINIQKLLAKAVVFLMFALTSGLCFAQNINKPTIPARKTEQTINEQEQQKKRAVQKKLEEQQRIEEQRQREEQIREEEQSNIKKQIEKQCEQLLNKGKNAYNAGNYENALNIFDGALYLNCENQNEFKEWKQKCLDTEAKIQQEREQERMNKDIHYKIKKLYGLEVKVRTKVSWNDRQESGRGWRLASENELSKIGIDNLRKLFSTYGYSNDSLNKVLTNDSRITLERIDKKKVGNVFDDIIDKTTVGSLSLIIFTLGVGSTTTMLIPSYDYVYIMTVTCWNNQLRISPHPHPPLAETHRLFWAKKGTKRLSKRQKFV